MSEIYFLGREDADGLARLNRRPLLTFDEEVGGWDTMYANDELYYQMPRLGHRGTVVGVIAGEPALKVFDSRVEDKRESKVIPEDEPWPTITYQVRFGEDQRSDADPLPVEDDLLHGNPFCAHVVVAAGG